MFRRQFQRTISIFHNKLSDEKSSKLTDLLENSVTFPERKQKQPLQEWSTLPYPEGTVFNKRDQGAKALRPKVDPRETSIILFPGQGTQYVGMGAQLVKIPEVLDMFELASEVLKYNLLELCLRGPKKDLDLTIYAQPAIMVTSLACLEKLKEERPNAIESCVASAGFSLGEITALIFAGAIPFDQGVKLVQIRAEAMQLASDMYKSGMATVLYGPDSKVSYAVKAAKEWCIEKGVEKPDCIVANYLYPHCKVIAGSEEALKFIETNYKEFNLRKVKRLPVSGAFHTSLMEAAVEPFRKALNKVELEDPAIPVHSNIDGLPYKNAEQIRRQLPKQIIKPVKWEQTLHILYERKESEQFPRTFECGPGRGLRTILKQVNAKAWDTSFSIEP
uniref:[acyl-carrier-protein] S-malonyltransferase n=1 Tax=Culicoides sonorensis TaxID=179676 RepID=A0A336LY83_CULSO